MGRVLEGSWTSGSAAPRPEEPAGLGLRAASPAPHWPPGVRLWAGRAPGWSSRGSRTRCHWGCAEARALRGGNVRPLGGTPGTFRPVWEASRRRTMGPGVGLQRRALLTSAISYPPPRPTAPTPPPFQLPLSPRQQEGAEVGIAWGRKVRPQGIFSSRGEPCNPQLPPRPRPTAPIPHLLGLSRQQGRRRRRSRRGHSPGNQFLGEVSTEGCS